jgi:hypothetical protein
MERTEKEARILAASGAFPSWREFMELAQWKKNERLRNVEEAAVERDEIEREYEATLDNIIAAIGKVSK